MFKPLEYITPSLFNALQQCALRVAFQTHDPPIETFQGTHARLGTICHRLIERVATGELRTVAERNQDVRLEEIWSEEVTKQEQVVFSSELEKHLGSAETWPNYTLQKARVWLKANKLLAYQRRTHAQSKSTRELGSEHFYQAFDGKLRGRADFVFRTVDGVKISDYKTGSLYEADTQSIKQSYRQQLLLYAAMHYDQTGDWPNGGYLVPLTGKPVQLEIDPSEAAAVAEHALALMEQYNQQLISGIDSAEFASPSATVCQFCSYKTDCEPFWSFLAETTTEETASGIHVDMIVENIVCGYQNEITAQVNVLNGSIPSDVYRCCGTLLHSLVEGQRVRAVNLKQRDANTLVIRDYSVVTLV